VALRWRRRAWGERLLAFFDERADGRFFADPRFMNVLRGNWGEPSM
jgi:hypothetical protein